MCEEWREAHERKHFTDGHAVVFDLLEQKNKLKNELASNHAKETVTTNSYFVHHLQVQEK